MPSVIRSEGLVRRFGTFAAVDGIDLDIPGGCISAFLGPNGAGKTTAIRMLLGLMRPSSGTCEVLGLPPGDLEALGQIGAMVETPSLYGHLTGFENLEITRLLRDLPASESARVLDQVGLTGAAHRPVQTYSLGMRQRLGLALALIGDPKLLILDEPTNGLDPSGIQEMRDLIRSVPRETGATVFLSSHLLAEVEQVADHLVVIHQGHLKYQGPLEAFGGTQAHHLRFRVGAEAQALEVFARRGLQVHREGKYLEVMAGAEAAPQLAQELVAAGVPLLEMAPRETSLETKFLSLVGRA